MRGCVMATVRRSFKRRTIAVQSGGLMLTAYLDETGHEGKDLVILAGFLGTAEQWEKCETDWRAGTR